MFRRPGGATKPLRLLIPLAIVGPPILAIGLAEGLPHDISSTASVLGLKLYPFAAALLVWRLVTWAPAGGKRIAIGIVGGCNAVLWMLIAVLGSLVG